MKGVPDSKVRKRHRKGKKCWEIYVCTDSFLIPPVLQANTAHISNSFQAKIPKISEEREKGGGPFILEPANPVDISTGVDTS